MKQRYVVQHDVDLCVIGGGLAGVLTAISAARCGIKVVLYAGPPGSAGIPPPRYAAVSGAGSRVRNLQETGIIEEIMLENTYRNPSRNFSIWDTIYYEKVRFLSLISSSLLNCTCCEAEIEGDMKRALPAFSSPPIHGTP